MFKSQTHNLRNTREKSSAASHTVGKDQRSIVHLFTTVPIPSTMSGLSLAQQLKQLHSNNQSVPDPENAYSNLDSHDIQRKGDEGREHYVDVGPSRLRMELGGTGGGTLTGPKYEGVKTGRMKIFDDDEDEESGGEEGSESAGDEDDDEDEEEDEGDFDEEEDEEDDEDDEDEEDEDEEEEEEEQTLSRINGPKQALDPVASLRNSRLKDIEKGQAIRKQKVGRGRGRLAFHNLTNFLGSL